MNQLSYLVFEYIVGAFAIKHMLSLNKYLLKMSVYNKLLNTVRERKQGNMK